MKQMPAFKSQNDLTGHIQKTAYLLGLDPKAKWQEIAQAYRNTNKEQIDHIPDPKPFLLFWIWKNTKGVLAHMNNNKKYLINMIQASITSEARNQRSAYKKVFKN